MALMLSGWAALSPAEAERLDLYGLHRMLVFAVEPAYRHYPDTRQYDWARGQLDRLMARLK